MELPLYLALAAALLAVAVGAYLFWAALSHAAEPPDEPSVTCMLARNATAYNATASYCAYNGTHVIYLSPR